MRYFHGGFPGLRPGDRILPPDTTGTEHRLSAVTAELDGPAHATRTDVVYLTTRRPVAAAYAAFYPDGALYEAEPTGPVEPDPDCYEPGLSWQCPAAVVTAVLDPVVLFRTRTPERWLRMLNSPAQTASATAQSCDQGHTKPGCGANPSALQGVARNPRDRPDMRP